VNITKWQLNACLKIIKSLNTPFLSIKKQGVKKFHSKMIKTETIKNVLKEKTQLFYSK